jgi:hypothetical protein
VLEQFKVGTEPRRLARRGAQRGWRPLGGHQPSKPKSRCPRRTAWWAASWQPPSPT